LGFDGTPATSDDGSAGRPAITLVPTVTILDDSTLLVQAVLPQTQSFTEQIKEVYLQLRGASSFTPVSRFTIKPITKTTSNEVKIEITIEVA
jgi:hypothetical protein